MGTIAVVKRHQQPVRLAGFGSNLLAVDADTANFSSSVTSLGIFAPATANSNTLVFVMVESNGGPVTGISDDGAGAIGPWTELASINNTFGGPITVMKVFWAIARNAISASTITITVTHTNSHFMALRSWVMSGANLFFPFDGAAKTACLDPAATDPQPISTSYPNTACFACYRLGSTSTGSAGAGFTALTPSSAQFQVTEYKIVTTPQDALSMTLGTGAGDAVSSILFAVRSR